MPVKKSESLPARVRVLLVEYYLIVREGFKNLLENDETIGVVIDTDNVKQAVELAESHEPDVIVLSLPLGGASDIEVIPELLEVSPDSQILILISEKDTATQQIAVRLGAAGVVYKEQTGDQLVRAIKHISTGETWLNHKLISQILNGNSLKSKDKSKDPEEAKIEMLTDREIEVIQLIGKGLKNKAIAKTLFISEATVRHHLSSFTGN